MPEHLAEQLLARNGIEDHRILEYYRSRMRRFLQSVQTNQFTEIIMLPELESVIAGKVKVALSDMLDNGAIYYTPEEYLIHLHNVIVLLNSCDNYHIHIVNKPTEEQYMVYVKEELGVIVAKTSSPPVVLAINEGNMTTAFWDYLKIKIGEKAYTKPSNTSTTTELSNYLEKLQDLLAFKTAILP